MKSWKDRVVLLTIIFLAVSFLVFFVAGYTALYWAWARSNLQAAQSYLTWARNSGALAIACAAVALGILFSTNTFPLAANTRLLLSLLVTITIGFFAEFRNEGKFYFKGLHHFFGPATWIHKALNHLGPSLGDFLYRMEYSHWNDFLMGPAIVSVLFPLVGFRIYKSTWNQRHTLPGASTYDSSNDLDQAMRFARILMNVGLFWFFCMAWAEKAGYIANPHSSDEFDLPFEFGGTILGFWMARILTQPFDQPSENFESTFAIDFLSSGVIGLLYTIMVSPLTQSLTGAVAHALYPTVPPSLEIPEYTPFQRHLRPLELLLLAVATWWCLNRSSKPEEMTVLGSPSEGVDRNSQWLVPKTAALVFAVITGYLVVLSIMLSLMEPQGLGWTIATAGIGLGVGTAAFLLSRRAWQKGLTGLLDEGADTQRNRP